MRLQDVAEETWIQETGSHSWCGSFHEAVCAKAGFSPNVGFRSDDYNVVQGLIAAGVGISLLPGLALTNVREDIVIRSLGPQAPSRQIAAATLAGRYRSPATGAMLEILDEVAARFELPSGAAIAASALGDLPGHDGGVLAHADQERRLPLAEEVHAREVQPRDRRARAVPVDGEAELVEGAREVDP